MIERKYIGGSSFHIVCLPSKNIIHRAKVASCFRRGAEFGSHADDWKIDMAGVRARKRAMVDGLIQMHRERFEKSGAELILGSGRFVAPETREATLGEGEIKILRGEQIISSTDSRARR